MSQHDRADDKPSGDDPTLLPDREAMSLLPLDPAGGDLAGTAASQWGAQTPDPSSAVPADATDSVPSGSTDADASGTEGGSVTSDDRSETFTSSDSASSET